MRYEKKESNGFRTQTRRPMVVYAGSYKIQIMRGIEMPEQPIQIPPILPVPPVPVKHNDTPPPKTFKEFMAGIFWRDIDVCAGGGKELRINVISFILIIATLVVALVILEKVGVIDDFVQMRQSSHEKR